MCVGIYWPQDLESLHSLTTNNNHYLASFFLENVFTTTTNMQSITKNFQLHILIPYFDHWETALHVRDSNLLGCWNYFFYMLQLYKIVLFTSFSQNSCDPLTCKPNPPWWSPQSWSVASKESTVRFLSHCMQAQKGILQNLWGRVFLKHFSNNIAI